MEEIMEANLARVTAERDAAVALAERLQAGWDSNAQIGTQALADLRRATDAAIEVGRLALRVKQERDNALVALAEWQDLAAQNCNERDAACAENARLREALEVYRDRESWQHDGDFWVGTTHLRGWELAEAALAGEAPDA